MSYRCHCAAALILLLGVTQPCAAQNAPAPRTVDPRACSDEQRLRAGSMAPQLIDPSDKTEPSNKTLSEKLAQTDGVICPPNIDPDIKAATPEAGKMLVIPPPGSPGGDPTVRPK
jgi:DNA-binding transcriptional regulator YdaS (Cro superfamily)